MSEGNSVLTINCCVTSEDKSYLTIGQIGGNTNFCWPCTLENSLVSFKGLIICTAVCCRNILVWGTCPCYSVIYTLHCNLEDNLWEKIVGLRTRPLRKLKFGVRFTAVCSFG